MSKQTNPTLIGAFVVGAIALLAVAAAMLGAREYFTERLVYVSYFSEQTKGLRVGSNVLLNGVRVGYVSDIALLVDQSTYNTLTQVTMEVLPEALQITEFGEVVRTEIRIERLSHDTIVEKAGLRAQLETESYITGTLVVTLKMRPDTPAIYRGINPAHQEIPTIPSNVQAILAKLREFGEQLGEDFDLTEMAEHLNSILVGLEELSNSEELRKAIAGVSRLVNDEELQALAADMGETLEEIRAATTDVRSVLQNTNEHVDDIAGDLGPAIENLAGVMEQAEQTLGAAQEQLRGESVQMYQLQSTLEQVERAAVSMRNLLDYLERHPEALLRGKN